MTQVASPEELAALIETLIEGQALLVSSVYIDIINLGLIEPQTAASRLEHLADVAMSPLQRHPETAEKLAARIRAYARGLERGAAGEVEVKLRLIAGGKTD